MILYRGSNVEINEIDFSQCKPYKDFGKGFYLTSLKEQAMRMAENRAALYGREPVVTIYEVDDDILCKDDLNTKSFDLSPTIEWARFIVNNRSRVFDDVASLECNIDAKYDVVLAL